MKKTAVFMLASTLFCAGDGLEWRAKPCIGKTSEASTKNLIEYHTLRTPAGDYIFACEKDDGMLRISQESISRIGKKRADRIIADYNILSRSIR